MLLAFSKGTKYPAPIPLVDCQSKIIALLSGGQPVTLAKSVLLAWVSLSNLSQFLVNIKRIPWVLTTPSGNKYVLTLDQGPSEILGVPPREVGDILASPLLHLPATLK